MLSIINYILFSIALFFIALLGILINRRSVILVLLSIELIFLAVNFNFVIFSVYLDDIIGQVITIFVLTVAAAESAIGLAILVIYYRVKSTIAIDSINLMHGLEIFLEHVAQWLECLVDNQIVSSSILLMLNIFLSS